MFELVKLERRHDDFARHNTRVIAISMEGGEDAKKTQAALQCKSIEQACQAYYLNSQSNGSYPQSLNDLLQPFGGTQAFLKNGQLDLNDPWHQQFQYNPNYMGPDGSNQVMVSTRAPDGTAISNFGIGPNSRVQ